MKMYFSGGGVKGVWSPVNEKLLHASACRLISFAYKRLVTDYITLAERLGVVPDLMLDSGAFTSWTKGEDVVLDEFLLFIDKVREHDVNLTIINLDKIPGKCGEDPTEKMIHEAMAESDKNLAILKAAHGDIVLPVYHQGEPKEYLDELMAGSPYVCLSPRNDLGEKHRVTWVSDVWVEGGKFHGLAATGRTMMGVRKWHSVDSAGWVMSAGMGSILWNDLRPIAISEQSSSKQTLDKHFDSLPLTMQEAISDLAVGRGLTIESLKTNDVTRYLWNIDAWLSFVPEYRTAHQKTLFDF